MTPFPEDKVTVIIKDNDQEISGTVTKYHCETDSEGKKTASCHIQLNDIIKIFPPSEVWLVQSDNIKRHAAVASFKNNLMELYGIDLNER